MDVILDTTSIHDDFLLKGTAINKLVITAKERRHRIFIPEVVVLETIRHYQEKLEEIQGGVEKGLRDFKRKANEDLTNPITASMVKGKLKKYRKDLTSRIKELGMFISPVPEIDHDTLLHKSINKSKPFKDNGSGYEDALIWATVLDKASEFNQDNSVSSPRILFVTNNHTDFCQSDQFNLHIDLLADLDEHEINHAVIKVVPNINDAFNLLFIDSYTAKTNDIKSFLASPKFTSSDLIFDIKKRLMDYLPYNEFTSEEVGFPDIYESPTIDMFHEDFVFETESVEVLSEQEVAINLNVSVTCLFDIYIAKSDLAYISDTNGPSVFDYDWNDHYAAAQEEKNVWFTAELIVDSKLNSIESCDFEINADRNDVRFEKFLKIDV